MLLFLLAHLIFAVVTVRRFNRANLGAGFTPAKYQLGGDSYPQTLAWVAAKVALFEPHAGGGLH